MQRTIKILTILAAMIITAGQTWADAPSLLTGNGEGTSDTPYQISSYAALKEFASIVNGTGAYTESANPGAYAILTADIVCKNIPDDEGYATDWVPIGNISNQYTGTFNGQGYSIIGLSTPTDNNSNYVGLFGYIGSDGVVKNVILDDATMTGNQYVGAVVGYNNGTLTDNYYRECRVNNATTNIGTGSGDCDGASGLYTITLPEGVTAATVAITNTNYYTAGQTITLSAPDGYAIVSASYNDGTDHVIEADNNNYSFTMPASNVTVSATFTPDIATHWHADADHDGSSAEKAYIITTTTGLNLLASEVNSGHDQGGKYFELGDNITYTHTTDWNNASSEENNYTAIGGYYNGQDRNFNGFFDGKNHTVKGIRIYKSGNSQADNCQGIFGEVGNAGYVKNITLTDARITGWQLVGGIAGLCAKTIENCHVTSTVAIHAVANNATGHGGILGGLDGGSIIGCTSEATLTIANGLTDCGYYGGIAGNINGNILHCLAIGANVSCSSSVGAIVASVIGNGCQITNNYYTACTVNGTANASNVGTSSGDDDGIREARIISLGDGISIVGDQTPYNVSGLIAYGTTALSYNNGTTTTIYSGKDANVTLTYTGNGFVQVTGLPEGYAAVENQPMQRQFTMPATDVELTATAVTAPTITDVTYDGTAHAPEIQQGAPENYAIAYKQGENAVTEAKNVGNYTCTMTGLGQYIGTTSVDFAITKRSTSLAVEIVDPVTTIDGHPILISGDDAHVKVTLNPVAGEGETNLPKINGYVTISVNDGINEAKPYTVAIVNGEGHYYVANLAQDAYAITASFAGDDNYTASATEDATTLEVCKILTEITCSLNKTSINVGESLDVTVKINEVGLQRPVIDEATNKKKEYKYASSTPLSVDAVVTIKAGTEYDRQQLEIIPNYENNNYTFGFTGGQGTKIFSHLPAGTRYFRAVYAGDDKFTQSECQNKTLIVNKKATTIGVDVTSPVIAK